MKILITSLALLASSMFFAQETSKKDSTQTKKIEEVVMTKKVFQKKADRMIFDVANSPIAKGTNAFDLLKETPLVSSTDNATLKILGKNNAIIYINGKKSNMDAEAVVEMLKNMPSENISKIEIITVPSSEFVVESNDGIINIILKKKQTDGLNGTLKLADTQSFYNQPSAALSLNYRKGKLGIDGNVYSSLQKQERTLFLTNGNDTYKNTSIGAITNPNKNLGGYLNLDYELTPTQNIGLSYNTRFNSNNSQTNLNNTAVDFSKNTIRKTNTFNDEDSHAGSHSLNLNYELKTDEEGSKLILNSSYLNFQRLQQNVNNTKNLDTNNIDLKFLQKTPQKVNNFGFQADYVQKLKQETTLSFGGNYNHTKTDNDTTFENLIPPTGSDADLSNHFVYMENISGIYGTLEKSFGEKLSGKLGARLELTHNQGDVLGKNDPFYHFKNDYANILPYATANYNFNKDNTLSYTFSSRIRRPSFSNLNPSRQYLTENNYLQNNPFMKASTYYIHELNYMYKSSYFLILNHTFIKDENQEIPLQKTNANGETELRYIRTNYGDKQEIEMSLGMQKTFFKGIWSANNSLNLSYNIFKGSVSKDPITNEDFPTYDINKTTFYYSLEFNNNIRLSAKKDLFLGVHYFYLSPQQIELGKLKSLQSLDFSVKKLYKDWTFMVELNDVFGKNRENFKEVQNTGFFNSVDQNRHNKNVSVKITYNFGNKKVEKIRKTESANSSIKDRT
ncbi:TonB-dependent receptor domain-containing protein [Halpernia frigidisoli]|uniref:Outer membrane receptor proteins, mostly Fe transport n=1 Tax=Halpernia frigidisoli TaxID=1125876 RepID=A0A1I3FWL8_9FLAO|nr:TonB-dependent receptor [Halpernia frigidisoli]SFI15638.1 Outer membrane receptor proteins, mostly Fe transport [Halpernia frigidisoli]